MGRMKDIAIEVDDIMEDIDNRLKDKSAAYGVTLTGELIRKLQQKRAEITTKWQAEITTKWLEEEVKND
jgi:hypothetical protein